MYLYVIIVSYPFSLKYFFNSFNTYSIYSTSTFYNLPIVSTWFTGTICKCHSVTGPLSKHIIQYFPRYTSKDLSNLSFFSQNQQSECRYLFSICFALNFILDWYKEYFPESSMHCFVYSTLENFTIPDFIPPLCSLKTYNFNTEPQRSRNSWISSFLASYGTWSK